jgi:hypothetical protein
VMGYSIEFTGTKPTEKASSARNAVDSRMSNNPSVAGGAL